MAILNADGTPSEYGQKIEIPFVWANQSPDRKTYILSTLADGIQKTMKDALVERIKVSFDADSFRKLRRTDIWRIQMQLNIPVSLIMEIIDGLDKEIQAIESREGTAGTGETPLSPLSRGAEEPSAGESGIR